MKKIVMFFIVLATVSCNENSLKVWTNYNQSTEILENSKNDNQRLRYNRIQSISNDKNNLISDFKNDISKFLVERYDQIKDLIIEKSIPEIQKSIFQKQFSYYELTLFYLSRIYLIEFNKEQYLNSIISINKNVLKEAKLSDQNSKNKNHLIYGIPILLKDNVGFDGLATTAGAFSLKDNLTDDSYIVKK